MKNKILFALTSHDRKGHTGQPTGFYLSEAAHPWAELKAAGYEIDFVSPQGGKPPIDGHDLEDPTNKEFIENTEVARKINNTPTPEQIKSSDYDAILFVGGHGTMWDFPENTSLAHLASSIYENGGIVGAVCHGPSALVNLKLSNGEYLVKGKRVAAFTDEEEHAVNLESVVPFLLASKLNERGATHVPAPNWQCNVIVDERLVTGQNPASATKLGQEMVTLLGQINSVKLSPGKTAKAK